MPCFAISMGSSLRQTHFLFLAVLLVMPGVLPSFAQAPVTAEQERQALIQVLQKRFPGTGPADWQLGVEGLIAGAVPVVQAIPFNSDNATNSADILAIGKKRWERKFKDGKSFGHCFPNGGKRIAAAYPQYDAKSKLVVTLEMALNRCLLLHGEAAIDIGNLAVMGPLSAYARNLSEGQRIAVRVATPAAKAKFDAGKAFFSRRIGQSNYACASCHVQQAGGLLGVSLPGNPAEMKPAVISPVVGQATAWPRLEPGGVVRTLQMQFQQCMLRSGAEPLELASEEFNNLEYFHGYLSNGLPIRTLATQR